MKRAKAADPDPDRVGGSRSDRSPVATAGSHKPADRSRWAQLAIQEQIKEWIVDRGLKAGEPIPTESELVANLGVSRNSVREALKALQALGIVEIRHGFGTYVGDCSLEPFTAALVFRGRRSLRGDRRELYEILDLRQVLETGLVAQLAKIIDDASLQRVGARLADLEKHAGTGAAGDAADRAFHDELYATLGNQITSQLLRVFWDVYNDLRRGLPTAEMSREQIISAHRAIYEAVSARDAARASAAMAEHFDGIRKRIDS